MAVQSQEDYRLKVSAGASKEGLISRVGRVGAMNRIKHKRWPPQWAECCYSRVSAGSAAIVPLIVGIRSTHRGDGDHEIGNHVRPSSPLPSQALKLRMSFQTTRVFSER